MIPSPTHVRRLFLQPKRVYTVAEAAELLGMSQSELDAWIESGDPEGTATPDGLVLPWGELVSFAMGLWEQEDVEAALGDEVASAIPELWRLTPLDVRLPKIEVWALEELAAQEGRSVASVLSRELLDLVSANSRVLAEVIPGFAAALAWP